jgi:hypothetical protein
MAKSRRNRSRKGTKKANRSSTRKAGNASESWPQAVKRVYNEMKAKNKNYKFKDAMSEASNRKKAGTL